MCACILEICGFDVNGLNTSFLLKSAKAVYITSRYVVAASMILSLPIELL